MTEKNLADALREIEFLEGFENEHIELLASIAEPMDFDAAKVIFREGDTAEYVYLIADGSVSLEVCAPAVGCRRILTIDAGNLLGWSPVLGQTRLTATARTLAPTKVFRISSNQILTLCEHNPRFGYEFVQRVALGLAKRLRAARLQLLDVFGSESTVTKPTGPN